MALTKVTSGVRTLGTGEVATANMAVDPTNASNLSSGDVPLAQLDNVDTSGITANQDDIALLGFKVAANGSLARYDLVDQSIDAFEDASGVDASASTNEIRDASKYYSGSLSGSVLNAYTSGSGNFTAPAGVTSVEVLVVAGGGGGGGYGGGGGAGGIVHHTGYTVVPASTYAYSIGTGGGGGTYNGSNGAAGGDTTFGTGTVMTAVGGGGGGSGPAGSVGGNGGGGNSGYNSAGGVGNQGDSGGGTGYGHNDGGQGYGGGVYGGAGGGATADGTAGNVPAGSGGHGGAGKLFAGFEAYGTDSSNVASTGSNGGYFAGGGGGCSSPAPGVGPGGVGGGADGETSTNTGKTAIANTGGGGGAATNATGGVGAAGIVIVRQADQYLDMTLVSNAQTAQDGAPTTGDLVITYTDGAGTATVNTDIKAYISRDGSAYTSAVTLVSQGTTGGHTILTANGVDLSGITTGTSMRWKIETLNQAVGKQTRIQAVALGWS